MHGKVKTGIIEDKILLNDNRRDRKTVGEGRARYVSLCVERVDDFRKVTHCLEKREGGEREGGRDRDRERQRERERERERERWQLCEKRKTEMFGTKEHPGEHEKR